MSSKKILIVIPTYNERENIPAITNRLLRLNGIINILVVDDNSPDGTGEFIREYGQRDSRVYLLQRPRKSGLGSAYVAGFKWALARDYETVIAMDADLSHHPRYIPKFIQALDDSDVVVGSRWIQGGGISNWSVFRLLLSRLANLYSQWVLSVPLRDLTGGFTAYRRSVLESINLDKIRSDGYSFQIEMKYRALKKHFKVGEIPIHFSDRRAGKSKISRKIVFEALWMVWLLRLTEGFTRSGR